MEHHLKVLHASIYRVRAMAIVCGVQIGGKVLPALQRNPLAEQRQELSKVAVPLICKAR